MKAEASAAFNDQDAVEVGSELDELASLGVVLTVESAPGFRLSLDSLEQRSRHRESPRAKWLLLSVTPGTDPIDATDDLPGTEATPDRALVWVSDDYRDKFLALFDDYLTKPAKAGSDHPKNRPLVANMAGIKAATLDDLWQSAGTPPVTGRHWWEIWLAPTDEAIGYATAYASALSLEMSSLTLRLDGRHVVLVRGTWSQLLNMPFTSVPVTEIRRPELPIDTIEDLPIEDQFELIDDVAARIAPAAETAPAVCLLDSGVRRTHQMLAESLAPSDVHTVVGEPLGDIEGHGTAMAGLALFGPQIDELLAGTGAIDLVHRLESVKLKPDSSAAPHHERSYGVVTAAAMALPEIESQRRRLFCLPITCANLSPGEPTLWSATVDALAAGTAVAQDQNEMRLLGPPEPDAARLILISAGNVDPPYEADHYQHSDLSPIDAPAQAWNALTVGAFTNLVGVSSDPSYHGWRTVANEGELSPHSRTNLLANSSKWPIKPDICMEGGNVISDGHTAFEDSHPLLSLRTTDNSDDASIGSANATSAATAQASRLAALAMVRYPTYWPETIRGLLPHHAEWTPAMRAHILTAARTKTERREMLNRFGWGVPDEESVLSSSADSVTMVVQDEFVPFTGSDHKIRHFRLHRLPWPTEVLAALGAQDVEMRVTLSYFVEPSAARRGWRSKYAYASHGLRFDLQAPQETTDEFIKRFNRVSSSEEDGTGRVSSATDRWTVGPNQRNQGSLHQDIWSGFGADLAATGGVIAVNAVGGWWKYNKRNDRADLPVRYALIVSLRTKAQDVDLYAPIAAELTVPVEAAAITV